MKFSIYNNTRTINLFDRIVKDYEKTTGKQLDSDKIEDILRANLLDKYVKYISDEDLTGMIEKDLCRKAYIPYIYLTIYGNKVIKIPILHAEPYANFQGLTADTIETMIDASGEYENPERMTESELEKAVVHLMEEELSVMLFQPKLEEYMKEKKRVSLLKIDGNDG